MEEKKKSDRFSIIKKIILTVFVFIICKILYMTTIKHEHYNELAENKTYKKLLIDAPRGEIRDRYGRLLAGNKNLFTVKISGDDIKKTDSNGKSMANDIALKTIKLLEKNNEEYVDEFPIVIKNGKYSYTFDKEIREYKEQNNIPKDLNAKESFYYLVDKLIAEGTLSKEDKRLEAGKLQSKLNENGYYPPILVSKWMFTEEKNKVDWLKSYKIENTNINAKQAFKEVRNSKLYEIDKNLSDQDARKILVVRDLIKSQGYSQYNPVTIAQDINEKTIAQIEENAIELVGVSVVIEPVRDYPNKSLASHVLGYVGKIPSNQEKSYLEKGYMKDDKVGLSGVEKSYEKVLKGTDGHKMVKVDAFGKITQEISVKEPKSGDTVYLSLDKDLQEVAEESLKQAVTVARTGGVFKSKFGNKTVSQTSANAKSGAVIAIDLNTGDVLASASYPDFDPNKFVTGISSEDYKKLQSENENDMLAARPLSNLVTQGAFQPGSTFKLITAMAALDNGLSPNYAINDPGVIRLGNRNFADYTWHKTKSNHGYTNLYKAIQESCNVYFYTIATGKNWTGKPDPGAKIGASDVLEYAKLFGLDESTGLDKEIQESEGKVPNPGDKLKNTKITLKSALTKKMKNYFTDITKDKDPVEYEKRIDEIVSWMDEEKTPGRVEAMNRIAKLKVKEDKVEEVADLAVFSYFNFAKWSTADTFNLSIGQGENAYTPAQMARAIAAIANGGNLVELSVVDKSVSTDYSDVDIDDNKKQKIKFNNDDNLKEIIKGMKLVSTKGTGKGVFANFPESVAVKTGTAEKSGKIPTVEEYQYLLKHMSSYGVDSKEAEKLAESMKKAREKELSKERKAEIKAKLEKKDLKEDERKSLESELKEGVKVKLENSDKVNAAYLRKAIHELNPDITDEKIDSYKSDYGSFGWGVAFAPADNPEIAVVSVIPQGKSSAYPLLVMREILGSYFGLLDKDKSVESADKSSKNIDKNKLSEEGNINFTSQMKK